MAFVPIALPPDTPTVVTDLIRWAVEPFLTDVHAMLQLPASETLPHIGCNLSIAQVLLASISGVSAVLYSTTGSSRAVFEGFMLDCYPWDAEPARDNVLTGVDAARILYQEYRNPLTHASGTPVFSVDRGMRRQYKAQPRRVQINRVALESDKRPGRGLTEQRINELESERVRPPWLPVTLRLEHGNTTLTVEALYWGLRVAVHRLCSDWTKMQAAVQFFGSGT